MGKILSTYLSGSWGCSVLWTKTLSAIQNCDPESFRKCFVQFKKQHTIIFKKNLKNETIKHPEAI